MNKSKFRLSVKDHSVSQEIFQLLYNEDYRMFETFPKPSLEKLPKYYQSADYISHTDSKRNLFEKTYQFIKRISLKRKLKLINANALRDKKLLDIGCGTGDFLQLIQKHGWDVVGVEPNEKARKIANNKTNNKVCDIDKLRGFENESFNVITLWHVLEHVYDLHNHIKTIKALLKKDGTIIIAVPNFKSFDAHYYKEFWAAYDVPRHLWHFSQESIKKLFGDIDMSVQEIKPMLFDAFYVSLLSEKYKTKRINIFKAFFIGVYSNVSAMRTKEYSSLIYIIKNNT